jgi:hypothetical protein
MRSNDAGPGTELGSGGSVERDACLGVAMFRLPSVSMTRIADRRRPF